MTPEQALEAKKMASAASSSSAKERREQAAGGTTTSSSPGSSKKSHLGSVGENPLRVSPNLMLIDCKVSIFLLNFEIGREVLVLVDTVKY